MTDLDYAARVLAEAAGLKLTQVPGLALVLRMLAHEAWQQGMRDAADVVRDGMDAERIQAAASRPRDEVFPSQAPEPGTERGERG